MKKTIAIHRNDNGKCDLILEICTVNEKEFLELKQECEECEELTRNEKTELKGKVESNENLLKEHTRDIKVLKGEE